MTSRKDIKEISETIKELDEVLTHSFQEVELDMIELVDLANTLHNDIKKLNKRVKSLEKDRKRETKVCPETGITYMTNTGKINALANFLGVNLEAKPAETIKASISVNKVKKGKKIMTPTATKEDFSIKFQEGTVPENGVNGLQIEEVLQLALYSFNLSNAELSCRENSIAITKIEESIMWLNKRMQDRIARNVEGTNEK